MIGAIVNWTTLGKVAAYSVVAGIGISVIFGAGVSSAASLVECHRQGRTAASIAWGVLAVTCIALALAAVVLAIVIMSSKG